MKKSLVNIIFWVLLVVIEIGAIIAYGVRHAHFPIPSAHSPTPTTPEEIAQAVDQAKMAGSISFHAGSFQIIHIMVFLGMGFLFAFLQRFRLTAVVSVLWVGAFTLQIYILWAALWKASWEDTLGDDFQLPFFALAKGEFCVMSIAVALGALIGKVNHLQLLIIAFFGAMLYSLNERIFFRELKASDIGGSIYVFCFGAFYGISISWLLGDKPARDNRNFVSNVGSNAFALIGTLFIWCFFLTFNSTFAWNAFEVNVSTINTYFALIGSTLGAYLYTTALHGGRFHMEHILNSTITGGVVIGAGANMLQHSYVAFIVGAITGIISAASFQFISRLFRRLKLVDVAGVFHTFGFPGLLGGILYSSIFRKHYGVVPTSLIDTYVLGHEEDGWRQLVATLVTLLFAIGGGVIVGLIVRFLSYHSVEDEYFNDLDTVYFDDVVDYHNNPQAHYDTQRRLMFGKQTHKRAEFDQSNQGGAYDLHDQEQAPSV